MNVFVSFICFIAAKQLAINIQQKKNHRKFGIGRKVSWRVK